MRTVRTSSGLPAAVTVLITAHNRLDYLPQTLASVYEQTFPDFDIVLFDDGSTDGTKEWITARKYPRLRYVRAALNRGPASARNAVLAEAKGEFAAFLDSDDLWKPDYLETMVSALKDAPAAAACCYAASIDSRGRILSRDFLRSLRLRNPEFKRVLGLPFFPLPSATVVRRAALEGGRGFDEYFRRIGDDADFFYRLALRHGSSAFRLVPRNLVSHRRHGNQLTGYIERGGDREAALDCAYFRVKHGAARLRPR